MLPHASDRPTLYLVVPNCAVSSETCLSKPSPAPSSALAMRLGRVMDRIQVLVLKKPKMAMFLLVLVERFLETALGPD